MDRIHARVFELVTTESRAGAVVTLRPCTCGHDVDEHDPNGACYECTCPEFDEDIDTEGDDDAA